MLSLYFNQKFYFYSVFVKFNQELDLSGICKKVESECLACVRPQVCSLAHNGCAHPTLSTGEAWHWGVNHCITNSHSKGEYLQFWLLDPLSLSKYIHKQLLTIKIAVLIPQLNLILESLIVYILVTTHAILLIKFLRKLGESVSLTLPQDNRVNRRNE